MASLAAPRKPPRPRKAEPGAADNLTARVTEAIRGAIVDAEFALGQALSEASLAARFGVSRTPVREALTTLQRQGLIVIRPQSGSFVFMPSEEDVAELCEFRRLIETAALRLAHARRRAPALAQMREAIAAMAAAQEAGDTLAYARADAAFHEAIVDNSANRYLIESYTLVSGRVSALRTRNLGASTPLRRRSTAAHRAIVAAFARGDLAEAEQIIDEHVAQLATAFRALRRAAPPD
jgi:DNA-binding GntR family transcriptional regulator